MSVTHLEVPFKVSAVGYYINTACGAYLTRRGKTSDRQEVTCRSCQRTHTMRLPVSDLTNNTAERGQ